MRRIERWLASSRHFRIVSGCLLLSVAVVINLGLIRWLWPAPEALRMDVSPEITRIQASLLRLPPRQTLEAKLAALNMQAKSETFVALAFSQQHQADFIRWQPGARRSELVLEPVWEHVPGLFSALTDYGLTVPTFSITKVDERLRLTLTLESVDEP